MNKFKTSLLLIIINILIVFITLTSKCRGLADGLIIMLLTIISISYYIGVMINSIFKYYKSKHTINWIPTWMILFLFFTVWLGVFNDYEILKSKKVLSASSIESMETLVLRKNGKFDIIHNHPEYHCVTHGNWTIIYDTLMLDNDRYFIDKDENLIKGVGDSTKNEWIIENNVH